MRLPSVKTIENKLTWLSKLSKLHPHDAAVLIRLAMQWAEGKETSPLLRDYCDAHGLDLSTDDPTAAALDVMDHTCGTYGVEYIASTEDSARDALGLEYLNTGDAYTPTVMYDHGRGTWRITSWGDIVERERRRFTG